MKYSHYQIERLKELNGKYLPDVSTIARDNKITGIISTLVKTYSPYYSGEKPFGVIDGQVVKAATKSSDENLYKVIEYSNSLKSFDELFNEIKLKSAFKFNYYKGDLTDLTIDEKVKYCFPMFHLAMCMGVKGIYAPLSLYLDRNFPQNPKLLNIGQLQSFLNYYIPQVVYRIAKNSNLDITKIKDQEIIINNFYNVFIVDEFTKYNSKITISNSNPSFIQEVKSSTELQNKIAATMGNSSAENKLLSEHSNYSITIQSAEDNDWKVRSKFPQWAYKVADKLKLNGGIDWGAIPLGKDMKTDEGVTINCNNNFGWMVNLIAGSGSGKGVTTMAIIGQAVAKGYPIMYLDCKPDMSENIKQWGGLAIDGNNHKISPVSADRFNKMKEDFKQRAGITGNNMDTDIEVLCTTLIWCRAVEIFLHLQHIRAQYKPTASELAMHPEWNDIINKNIHPVLVMDEFQAESNIIQSIITGSSGKQLNFKPDDGEARMLNVIKTSITKIAQATQDKGIRDYLVKIPAWMTGIFDSSVAGLCGQVATAFGRQAGCLIFTISQSVPNPGGSSYGELLRNTLEFYLNNGYIIIYGKGTDKEGRKYNLSRRIENAVLPGVDLKVGEFAVKGAGSHESGTRIKTYLTIDNAYNPQTEMPIDKLENAFKGGGDPETVAKLKEGIIDPNTGKVIEKRVSTLDYIADCANLPIGAGVETTLKPLWNKSIEFFDNFCKCEYGKTLVEELTRIDDDSFDNYLGIAAHQVASNSEERYKNKIRKFAEIYYRLVNPEEYNKYLELKKQALDDEIKSEQNGDK